MAPRLPRLVPDGGGPRYYYAVSQIAIALSRMVIAEPRQRRGSDPFPHMADRAIRGGQVAPLSGARLAAGAFMPLAPALLTLAASAHFGSYV